MMSEQISMQKPIAELVRLGRLPKADEADPAALEKFQTLLSEIIQPITDLEAIELARLIGPDDCYGLAWTIIHVIEEAPGWPLHDAIAVTEQEWAEMLLSRLEER